MKIITAIFCLLSISLSAHALSVSCNSATASVAIKPSDVVGRHGVTTVVVKGNSKQQTTYQPQVCTIDSQESDLNSASCKTPNDVMNAVFVLERNGGQFDLKQKVEIKGMSAEMLAPMNFTIASGLVCIVSQ